MVHSIGSRLYEMSAINNAAASGKAYRCENTLNRDTDTYVDCNLSGHLEYLLLIKTITSLGNRARKTMWHTVTIVEHSLTNIIGLLGMSKYKCQKLRKLIPLLVLINRYRVTTKMT